MSSRPEADINFEPKGDEPIAPQLARVAIEAGLITQETHDGLVSDMGYEPGPGYYASLGINIVHPRTHDRQIAA